MKYFRPVTKSMIQKLKECRARELDENARPFTMQDMNYAVGPLYKRGLIETKKCLIENKMLLCIYVTTKGIEFLEKLDAAE